MKGFWMFMVALLVAGCGGRLERPPTTPVTSIPDQGGWFCEPDQTGEGWSCVRDPDGVADPRRDVRPPLPDSRRDVSSD